MALTNPPVAVSSFDSGRLAAGISASATTITISPIYKTVNGVRTKQGLDTTSGIALITQGDFTERVSFEGASVNATTKMTTLTTCTRGLSATSTSASFTGGTGRAWPKGAKFTVVADVSYFQSSVYTTVPNTFTATQSFAGSTFSEAPTFAKGTRNTPFADTTARDAYFTAPTNGDECYVTGVGKQVYSSGSWVTTNAAGTGFATTTASGAGELATTAEHATGASTGGSGGPLLVPNSSLVKTSSGAGDENKIAVLGSTGKLAAGFIPESLSSVNFYGDGRDGTVILGSNTTLTSDKYYMNLDLGSYTLTTAGYRIFVRGLLKGTGKIVSNGVVGSAGANAGSGSPGAGGAGGSTPAAGTLPTSISPVGGGAGGASGAVGTAGTSVTTAVTNSITAVSSPANGGKGGDSSINSGADGGTGGTSTAYGSALTTQDAFYWALITNGAFTRIGTLPGAAGGGGGSCNAGVNTAGGGGGGGGGNGGAIVVAAYIIEGSFTFESKGAAGGAGGSGFAGTGQGGGGGGGGGGHGGHILVIYNYKTSWSGSATVTGGAGGAGGSGTGGGTANGVAGVTGTNGSITYIAL